MRGIRWELEMLRAGHSWKDRKADGQRQKDAGTSVESITKDVFYDDSRKSVSKTT